MEFEARFPALYKKAQAMRPVAAFGDTPSPPPGSPPPPFHSGTRRSQSFKDVDWAGSAKYDDDDFDLRKGPLVGPLMSGLDKMREAGNLPRSNSGNSFRSYHDDYPMKGKLDYLGDDYDQDYDEIDPKSEELGNDPGFQKAGAPTGTETGAGTQVKHERGGEDTLKKVTKKRPQIWERLRSGGTK